MLAARMFAAVAAAGVTVLRPHGPRASPNNSAISRLRDPLMGDPTLATVYWRVSPPSVDPLLVETPRQTR